MKKLFTLIVISSFFLVQSTVANKYFWVGNGGNWRNYSQHWALSSGGSSMHTSVPGINDTVYFDANSFSMGGQSIYVDTIFSECAMMDWSGIDETVEFNSLSTALLKIYGSCILSNNLTFNFPGTLAIAAPAPIIANLDFKNFTLKCNIVFTADSAILLSNLYLPYNKLEVIDGAINTNGYNVKCRHFNTDATHKASVAVVSPHWYNSDTLTVTGSMAIANAFDFRQNGPVYFEFNLLDSNYINMYTHTIAGKLVFDGNKKMYLMSQLSTNSSIDFTGSVKFYSRGYAIAATSISSNNSLFRTIKLSNSAVTLSGAGNALYLNSRSLYLKADSARLFFTYAGADTVRITFGRDSVYRFNEVHLPNSDVLVFNSFRTSLLAFAGSETVALARGINVSVSSMTSTGDCGQFNYVKAFCSDCPTCDESVVCDTTRPVFKAIAPVTVGFLKLRNIKAQGAVFTANNSFDEGNNAGWIFNEPSGPAALYWINGGGEWNNPLHWSLTSGGAPSSCIPSRTTNVVFNAASAINNDTVLMTGNAYCNRMTWNAISGNGTLYGKGTLNVSDSLQLDILSHIMPLGGIQLKASVAEVHTITSNNADIRCNILINGSTQWQLSDSLFVQGRVTFKQGQLSLNGQSLRCNAFITDGAQARTLIYNNSKIFLTGVDTVWRSTAAGLTLQHVGGSVNLVNPASQYLIVDAGNQTFDTLQLLSPKSRIANGTNCKLIKIGAGNLLEAEPLKTIGFDSLVANGSCDRPITLSSYAGSSDTAIFSLNAAGDSIMCNNLVIQNVCANNAGGRKYKAQNSVGLNKFYGWTLTSAAIAKTYYWTGLSSKYWNNLNNWKVAGAVPSCLPGPIDSVVFNNTHLSAPGSHDTCIVQQNAFCNAMVWTDTIVGKPALLLSGDVIATGNVRLCDSLTVTYDSDYTSTDTDAPLFTFMPQNTNSVFDPGCKKFAVNMSLQGLNLTDTLRLSDHFSTDSLNTITIKSGTFSSNQKNIFAGIIKTEGSKTKRINFRKSTIVAGYNFIMQNSSVLALNMDSSTLVMKDNPSFYNLFDGGGQTFNKVEFKYRETGSIYAKYYASIESNNNRFGLLKINPGLRMKIRSGTTQILDSIILIASCRDSIYIQATNSGSSATFNKPLGDSIRGICLNIKDITATRGASLLFSRNLSGNTGFYFNTAKPTNASFTLPPTTCFNTSTHFTNTSTAFSGSINDLAFNWSFGDTNTSTQVSPDHMYSNYSTYIVNLLSTDTTTGCQDNYKDTLTIYNPNVNLSSTQADLTICAGELVKFTAFSSNPSPDYLFMWEGTPVVQSPDTNHFSTAGLANGDEVYVILTYQGCVDTSTHFTFIVNSLPVIGLVSDDLDNTICANDSVNFTANGASNYQLMLNGSPFGTFDSIHHWGFTNLANGDQITVSGQNSVTGCSANSIDLIAMVVNPLPVVTLTSSDPDLSICAGNAVLFTAIGTANYEFFLNASSQGASSPVNTLSLTTLANGDVISVEGTSAAGCQAFSSDVIEFSVHPTPVVQLEISDADGIICAGQTVTYQASGADMYQFYVNGDSTGAFDYTNSFTSSTLADGDAVSVTGILGACPADADTIMVIDVRPTITWTYSSSTACADDTIHFTSHGDTQYEYFIDGIGATVLGPDSVFHAAGLINGQQITVGGSAGACVPSALTVTIHPLPIPQLLCSESDTAICEGDLITFNASGANQFAFYLNGIQLAPFSGIAVYSTDTLSNGETITLQGISTFGCQNASANSYTVEVSPYPVVTLSQTDVDQILCAGDTVSFTAGGANNYEFYITGASQGPSSPVNVMTTNALTNGAMVSVMGTTGYCAATSATTFTYVVNPLPIVGLNPLTPTSYCDGDTLSLLASGGTSYEFYIDGISTGAPSGNNVFASSTLTTGQSVTVTAYLAGCYRDADTSYTVTVNAYPTVLFSSSVSTGAICYGDTVTFEGNGAQSYIFYLDGIPASYDSMFVTADLEQGQEVMLTGGNGACWITADTLYHLLVNYVDVQLSCNQPYGNICAGDPLTFSATGADLYQFFVDGISAGATGPSGSFSPTTLSDGQVVSVEGTSTSNGCAQLALGDILVHVNPVPQITVTPAMSFCEGDSALLESSVVGNLQWYLDGSVLSGLTSASMYVSTSGAYQVASQSGGVGVGLSAGANYYGQLGDNSQTNSLTFREAEGLGNLTEIACGAEFSLTLAADGSVRAWGRNEFGALGTGNFTDSDIPVAVGSIANALHIGAGNRHGIAVLQDSTVLCWGDNTFGQLGLGNYFTSNFPFAVAGLTNIVDVAAGDNFSLALTDDGKVWAWGQNQYGQLGDGSISNSNLPVQVIGLDSVVDIRAGGNHSMAVKRDGSLWVWGANNAGQLGTGNYVGAMHPVKINLPIGIQSFDGGFAHSIAADSAGHVYTWGDNTFGQIGDGSNDAALYPKRVHAGQGEIVRAGQYTTYVIRSDQNVYSWGLNTSGQLGQNHTNIVLEPAAVTALFGINDLDAGSNHMAALSTDSHECISAAVNITVDTVPDVVVFVSGMTLFTTVNGSSYQWYFNGSVIPGANDSLLQISSEGVYAVLVTFANGCSALSNDFDYQLGLNEGASAHYSIFPNPSNGHFTIQLPASSKELQQITVRDMLGQLVMKVTPVISANQVQLELPDVSDGVYVVEMEFGGDGVVVRKTIVVN